MSIYLYQIAAKSLAQSHGDESRAAHRQSIARISAFCGFERNDKVVLWHVFNSIAFRLVAQRRAVGKTLPFPKTVPSDTSVAYADVLTNAARTERVV